MKTWITLLTAMAAVVLLLPCSSHAQSGYVILTGERSDALQIMPGDDGSFAIGPLSLTREGETHPIFNSIVVSSFNYKSTSARLSSSDYSGETASLVQYHHTQPVLRLDTAKNNTVLFNLASSAGALASSTWVVVGDADVRGDLFIVGSGQFQKSGDMVGATLEGGDTLFLRVRGQDEPEDISRSVATGKVSAETMMVIRGDVAHPETVSYDGSSISAISFSDRLTRFKVEGHAGIFAFNVPAGPDASVKVDGQAVEYVTSPEALKGGEAKVFLSHGENSIRALVYLPVLATQLVEIGTFAASEPAFTIVTALAAFSGILLVATASVYLFRR